MNQSEINLKIDRLSKSLGFSKLYVRPYSDKFALCSLNNLEASFNLSGMGYFEWNLGGDIIYVSDLLFVHSNVPRTYRGNLMDMLRHTLDSENLLSFLEKIYERFENKSQHYTTELELYSIAHKATRWFNLVSHMTTDEETGIMSAHGFMQDVTDFKISQDKLENSEDILFQMLNAIPLVIVYTDENDKIMFLNKAAMAFSKETQAISLGDYFGDFIDTFRQNYDFYEISTLIDDGGYKQFRLDFGNDQKYQNLIIDNIPLTNTSNSSVGEITVIKNITEDIDNKIQLKKLLKANELSIEIKDMIEKVDDLALVYDVVLHKIKEIIPNATKGCILILDEDEEMKITSAVGYDDNYVESFSIPFSESFANNDLKGNYTRSIIINNVHNRYKNSFPEVENTSRGFTLNSNITSPITVNNKLYGILSIDSSELNAFDELDLNLIEYLKIQLERTINRHNKYLNAMKISRIDSLTGAFNRRHLIEAFNGYIDNAQWQNETFSFVVFDLDGLKIINDVHGHLAGDKVLLQFSKLVMGELRSSDVFARYGGDEFVCLFFKGMNEVLHDKIASWREKLEANPITVADGSQVITRFSYGVATYPEDGKDFKSLMDLADQRMYVYKKEKKEARKTLSQD